MVRETLADKQLREMDEASVLQGSQEPHWKCRAPGCLAQGIFACRIACRACGVAAPPGVMQQTIAQDAKAKQAAGQSIAKPAATTKLENVRKAQQRATHMAGQSVAKGAEVPPHHPSKNVDETKIVRLSKRFVF